MELEEVNLEEKNFYNQFVANNEAGSFLQSWSWGDWQSVLGRQVVRFKIVEEGKVVGMMQLIKMPLPFGRAYWYCPYGPIDSDELLVKSDELLHEIRSKFKDAVFVRIEPKVSLPVTRYPSPVTKSANIQPGKTLVIDLSQTEEQILANMHHKTRYNIRLAEKHNVKIVDEFHLVNGKGIFAKEAVELIFNTAKRQGYKSQGEDYFKKLVNYFAIQNNTGDIKLHIYKALHENCLLASAIILDFGNRRTYLFGGSSENKKNLMAPYLLHFTAMRDAKKNGLTEYDFWGIETSKGDSPGFVKFKMGFNNSSKGVVVYAGAWDVVINVFAYKIYKVIRHINRLLN
ncbi:MAG: peptidoglycan bridge formation glycyltransferase FemA/FemB family protein [Candidatus Doudnabacteria bacterium]|nr:peptidoglycan bridge formation glycyltransferase FemA/FemB family protein [Candidatus Doudnabacteria bacterium]